MFTGTVFLALFGIFAIVAFFDPTQILGINRWIKPMKFFISIVIFLWTTSVYLHFLKGTDKSARIISLGMVSIFLVETLIVMFQAARGTTSHFNISTPLNGALFAIMGIAISLNTILAAYVLVLYFKIEIDLPRPIIWGMRMGLVLFLLSRIKGGYMSAQFRHTGGARDGGPGLPLMNWLTSALSACVPFHRYACFSGSSAFFLSIGSIG